MATKKEEKVESKLEEICSSLNKKYGSGTIIRGKEIKEDIEVVNSGSITLNIATDIGGIPVGRLVEIFGPESAGKSTLTLHIIAEFQKVGKKCALIDSEQSFDKKYAKALGVDVDTLFIVQPTCGEDGYNIIERLVRSGEMGLVVLDSQTALVPKKIIDGEIGDVTMALQARMNSVALQKIHPILRQSDCTMISIAQLRTAIGQYGDPLSPSGGLAYKFYSDMRLKMSKQISKETDSNRTTVEVIKNKCGVPFGKSSFAVLWGKGIDRLGEIIDLATEKKIIEVGGSWYSGAYVNKNDERISFKLQGEEKVKQYLKDNPDYLKELEKQVL